MTSQVDSDTHNLDVGSTPGEEVTVLCSQSHIYGIVVVVVVFKLSAMLKFQQNDLAVPLEFSNPKAIWNEIFA